MLWLGIICAIGASALYNTSIALQALEAREVGHEHALRVSLIGRLIRNPRWLIATLIGLLGWPLEIVALLLAPLTVVQWGRSSMFARRWDSKNAALREILTLHPAIAADRRGAARVYGQLAFGTAAAGDRVESWQWIRRSVRADPRQWRAAVALAVLPRPANAERVLDALHRFGRGV